MRPPTLTAEERIQRIFATLKTRGEEDVEMLILVLQEDPSPVVRHEAAYVLGEIAGERALQALIQAVNGDDNDFVVHEAALALGNIGDERGRSHLENLLNHSRHDVVQTAEIALERLEGVGADGSSAEPTAEERIQEAFRLLEENSETCVDQLIRSLHQEDNPIVKHEIVFALGETASRRATEELRKTLMTDSNRFVLHECLLALATLGDEDSEQSIRQFLSHPDPDVAETAAIALDRLMS